MTFFNFLLIVIITIYGTSFLFAIIEKLDKKNSLLAMYESGVLASSVPIKDQVGQMIEEVETEEVNEYEKPLDWNVKYNESKTLHVCNIDITPS
jgi:hypothetical protein